MPPGTCNSPPKRFLTASVTIQNEQLRHTEHLSQPRAFPLCYLLADMRTPKNVGGLFRLADALGAQRLYLCGTTPTPPNQNIRKTSRSTEKTLPYNTCDTPQDLVGQLKADGYTIICLELTSGSLDLRDLRLPRDAKVCLIVGSERSGVPQALIEVSDVTVHIPMMGLNSSMNVVAACAIATYEITKQLNAE